jgi:hypothetical protein
MAYYKYINHLTKFDNDMFDTLHKPGGSVIYSGIYRCEGCGKEISHNAGVSLPPQNHHQHALGKGEIRWRLIVWADTNG